MPRVTTVSPDQSQISTDITNPPADGTTPTTVYVSVKQDRNDDNGLALGMPKYDASEVTVTVTPSTGVTITQPTGTADEFGNVTASFVSTNAATVSVGATAFGATVTGNATVVVGGGDPVGEGLFFSDDFAGGVKTNDNGFTWNSTGSRVTVQLAPDASGDYALRFRYGPDADLADSNAEQRFNLGQDLSELWVQYELWVPSNWTYRSQSSGGTNNKFLQMWNTVYGSGSGTWQFSFEYLRVSASEASIRPMSSTQYDLSITSNPIGVRPGPSGSWSNPNLEDPFIGGTGPLTLGAWHQIRVHYKAASAGAATDGLCEMWIDGVLFATATGTFRNYDDVGDPVMRNGYFMGWANSGFADETDFYIRGGTNGPKFYNADPGWV